VIAPRFPLRYLSDVFVDNQAIIQAWNNQGRWGQQLNKALNQTLVFTTVEMNIIFTANVYIYQRQPSRLTRLSTINSCLTNSMWQVVQLEFGGPYKFCVTLAITTTVI
jgi:hypothetical protein